MQLRSKRQVGEGTLLTSSMESNSCNETISPMKLESMIEHEEDHHIVETILATTGPLSRNRFRSNLVGLSCLLIGLPGLLYIQKGQPFMGFVGGFMGLMSFYSDYVFACPFSFDMKFRRRAFAVDLVWITKYLGGIFINLLLDSSYQSIFIMLFGIVLGKILFLDWSARATTPEQWEWRHSCWHVVITGLAFQSHERMLPRKEYIIIKDGIQQSQDLDVFKTCITFIIYVFIAWLLTTLTDFILSKSNIESIVSSKANEYNEWYMKWSKKRYPSRLDIIRSVSWNGN